MLLVGALELKGYLFFGVLWSQNVQNDAVQQMPESFVSAAECIFGQVQVNIMIYRHKRTEKYEYSIPAR